MCLTFLTEGSSSLDLHHYRHILCASINVEPGVTLILAEQIKNAFQRTTIVCSIYSSTKSAYFACNYRACWIFIFTFCEVLFVDCQI